MKPLIGHGEPMAACDPVPHAVLVTGPEGVGKRLAVEHLALRTGARKLDLLRLGALNMEGARRMIEHHGIRPLSGPAKVSTADITRSSSEAVNAILKLLEEPPPGSHIILHSDRPPLLTIRSRCFEVRFGTLSMGEVAAVLEAEGMSEAEAYETAAFAEGRVSSALRHLALKEGRGVVEGLVAALKKRDPDALENSISGALRGRDGESPAEVDRRRSMACEAFSVALRGSVVRPNDDNPLCYASLAARQAALRTLSGASRPALRLRSAAWQVAAGMGK